VGSTQAAFVPIGFDLAHALLDLRDDGGNRTEFGAARVTLHDGVIHQAAINLKDAAVALRASQKLIESQ